MLEIIISAFAIATGFWILFRLSEKDIGDKGALALLIIGILLIGSGIWVIVSAAGLVIFILQKIIGIILLALGIFFTGIFPGVSSYQEMGESSIGIILGIVFLIVGFYIVFLMW